MLKTKNMYTIDIFKLIGYNILKYKYLFIRNYKINTMH